MRIFKDFFKRFLFRRLIHAVENNSDNVGAAYTTLSLISDSLKEFVLIEKARLSLEEERAKANVEFLKAQTELARIEINSAVERKKTQPGKHDDMF